MKSINAMYLVTLATALVATSCIVGCASTVERSLEQLTPRSLADVQQSDQRVAGKAGRPTVALVLGGGGLRGFAHLGVLRALEEAGVQPDIVVGTSAGAVVGAAYASGLSAARIEAIAQDVKISSLIDWTISSSGLMRGHKIAQWIDAITGSVPIEQFPLRFGAVATDLRTGKAVLIDRGHAGLAVQASAAVPGPNVPLAYEQGHLVDGGVASLVPVRFARAMGADVVIAVDVLCEGPSSGGMSMPSVLLQVGRLQSCMVAAQEKAEADILISPAVSVSGMAAKDEQAQAILAGYAATTAALRSIRERSNARIDLAAVQRAD